MEHPHPRQQWPRHCKGMIMFLHKVHALYNVVGKALTTEDLDKVRDIFDHEYGFDDFYRHDNRSPQEIWQEFTTSCQQLQKEFQSLTDPVSMYRAIAVPQIKDINLNAVGRHWTFDKKAARCINKSKFTGQVSTYYLQMNVPKDKVLWLESIARNISDPEEQEIVPREGEYTIDVYDSEWEPLTQVQGVV